ncbi:hypothetical protein PLESTB_001015500 [Pleodorina starrii]|uniref:Uncharacterized protein n=1 Tax=Pleodorina starrii TaxID=330485 RepID=A0A9W6F4A1_9CHLO|nr:hypothetical protein PLESTB_001015500 [Pleodorina starrii]
MRCACVYACSAAQCRAERREARRGAANGGLQPRPSWPRRVSNAALLSSYQGWRLLMLCVGHRVCGGVVEGGGKWRTLPALVAARAVVMEGGGGRNGPRGRKRSALRRRYLPYRTLT